MARHALLLGLDIGTSSTKALLIDTSGRVLFSCSRPHPISRPCEGWSEQNPADWWKSAREAIVAARLAAPDAEIAAIGLSGQMHGSIFLDAPTLASRGLSDAVIRPAILWNDQRTAPECAEIEAAVGGRAALVRLTGNAALPGFQLPKLLWLRKHEPEHASAVAAMLLPKDYIRWRMTGGLATDVGDASGVLLLDVERRRWSERALAAFAVPIELLPPVLESTADSARTSPFFAAETGLPAGIPVIAGSGDNQCGAVGAGVVEPGLALATLGTSGVIFAHTDTPRRDLPRHHAGPPGRTHCMAAATGGAGQPGGWCVTGVMLAAAGSLDWARSVLAPASSFEDLLSEAASAPAGCEGLTFLPYLTGERCPHPDPDLRGAWIGLSARHTRAHLLRAVVEGVTFNMAAILDLVRGLGVPISRVRLGGGGAKSAFWRQMQADVYGVGVELTNTEEGPAFGAALLAGVGIGVWTTVAQACREVISVAHRVEPAAPETYREPQNRFHRAMHRSYA